MSFASWASILADVASVAKAGAEVYSAYQQEKMAAELLDAKKSEYERQEQLAKQQAERDARVKKARLLAAQGGMGADTSAVQTGVIGIDTTLEAGLEDLAKRTDYNVESAEMQYEASRDQAIATAISGTIGTVSAVADINFSDWNTKTSTETNLPDYLLVNS